MRLFPSLLIHPRFSRRIGFLWAALEQRSRAHFYVWRDENADEVQAAWMLDPPANLVAAVTLRAGRCLVWSQANSASSGGKADAVRFATPATAVNRVLRGESVVGQLGVGSSRCARPFWGGGFGDTGWYTQRGETVPRRLRVDL